MKFNPHEYQKKAIEFIIQQACAGLFLDPGLGKTSIMMAAFHLLKKQGLAKRMLVVVPLRPMYLTWPAEARKWDAFRDLKVGILHGPTKSSVLNDEDVDIHLINPEGLKWLFRTIEDPESYWDILTIDESTRFKHADTDRFQTLKPHLEKFGRRYILTGSPAPNGLMDLFGQIFILDLGGSLGRYITHYRTEFFQQGHNGFGWVPRYGSEERIYRRIGPLVLRMSAEDYLELPPLLGACGHGDPLIREVELPPPAKKIYDQMEGDMITQLQGDTVTAANAAAVSNKCRQIANGGLYGSANRADLGDMRGMYDLHDAKTDAVEEIIEELQGTPALVAYEYAHDLDRLRRRFPDAVCFGAGVSPSRMKEIEKAWNEGRVPILLAQAESAAHGLNLQATKAAVIWHSITWNLETYEQFIRRVYRQGQKEPVFVHHVVAKGTIDETVMKMLQKKDKTQRALLTALKERYT